MLDIQLLRKEGPQIKQALSKKLYELDLEKFAELDSSYKQVQTQVQQIQSERNSVSKQVGVLIKEGMDVESAKAQVAEQLKNIDEQLSTLSEQERQQQQAVQAFLLDIPNVPADEVPEGNDENDNEEVLCWGEPASYDFDVKDHVDLGAKNSALDFDLAALLTGSRFAVMQGDIALMHRALIQFMLNTHVQQHGYQEVYVPYIVNETSLYGTGQLPKFADDLFKLEGTDYYLIPTAEVPVTNLLRDQIIDQQSKPSLSQVPLKFVAHTPCFRSEAGSYGRDTRGMIRQHQFEKVELVQYVLPEQGEEALESLTQDAENILQALNLPYRKVLLCGGDLGFSSRKTYDLEVWLPSQDCYREISSCSYFDSFQARRLAARYRSPDQKKPQLLHTLNGSGLAVGRCLLAILENNQQADGSIVIPEVLRPYMYNKERILAD